MDREDIHVIMNALDFYHRHFESERKRRGCDAKSRASIGQSLLAEHYYAKKAAEVWGTRSRVADLFHVDLDGRD
jgi:hypothetical protein